VGSGLPASSRGPTVGNAPGTPVAPRGAGYMTAAPSLRNMPASPSGNETDEKIQMDVPQIGPSLLNPSTPGTGLQAVPLRKSGMTGKGFTSALSRGREQDGEDDEDDGEQGDADKPARKQMGQQSEQDGEIPFKKKKGDDEDDEDDGEDDGEDEAAEAVWTMKYINA